MINANDGRSFQKCPFCRDWKGSRLLIVGVPGVGKTTMVNELAPYALDCDLIGAKLFLAGEAGIKIEWHVDYFLFSTVSRLWPILFTMGSNWEEVIYWGVHNDFRPFALIRDWCELKDVYERRNATERTFKFNETSFAVQARVIEMIEKHGGKALYYDEMLKFLQKEIRTHSKRRLK